MYTYKVTIRATAMRPIGDLDGSKELIESKFLVVGRDVLSASKGVLEKFMAQYMALMDVQITFLSVSPYDEGPETPLSVSEAVRRQAE